MRVRYVGDGALPLVGTTVVRCKGYSLVRDIEKLEKMVDLGYKFVINKDGKDIPAEEYFNKEEKVVETAKIEVVEEEEENTEEPVEEEITQCQAITSSGTQCQNEAKYPEEEPRYCGIHKSKLD